MYHLAVVTLLLVTVTSLLSLLSLSAAAPALSVAVEVVGADSTTTVSTVLCAVTFYVDRVSSIVSENLIIARLARVWDVLSPLATDGQPPYVVVKLYGHLYQLLALSRSIGYLIIHTLEIALKRFIPYLNVLYSISAVLLASCVYILLCGAPILVWYCLSFDEVITATLKPNPEPEPNFPYVTVRRRKLPRMLQEKHKREREQALRREAEREEVRIENLKHSKTDCFSTQFPVPSSTEMHSHPTDKGDVCPSTESAHIAPSTPIHELKFEPYDIAIPASPCSSSYSPPTQTICLDSDASSTSAGPTTPTLCTSASTGYMPPILVTQDYEHSDSSDGANISLNEGSDNKPESVAPGDARQDNLMNLTLPHSTPSALDQVASSLALQPEATTTHDLCIDVSRAVTPVATEVEIGITSQVSPSFLATICVESSISTV
ncbi:hypothetical protein FRC12_004960 [Ceratobasidium sp. 428]|nr:hypothetical protein FRC12_004960 [Ceratobasidium sp. 428]